MSAYRSLGFLTTNDEPTHRVRCAIHGFIRFSENERKIIDNRLFRRLRYIRQLAMTELLYPGATHTRFEHSLGVMEVATRAFMTLAAKRGDLLEARFRSVSGFEDRPLEKARQYLRLAALLHDVGHGSFSHAAENVIHRDAGHEVLSLAIVRENELLGGLLKQLFGDEAPNRVAQIIEGGRDLPPQMQLLHDLVSGEMDADRTDYLLRDSHHCGVEYGRFDYRRMIECLEIREGEIGTLEIALQRDGVHTFEALILARYQMNTQVYYHRIRRIYDYYLQQYHVALANDEPFTIESVLANNDFTMMARIIKDSEEGAGDRKRWATRIANRDHHRVIHETGMNANAEDLRRSRQLEQWLISKHPDPDYVLDIAKATIHKCSTPDDQDDDELVRIPLVGPDKRGRLVGFESQVLRKIPRRFQCARIFADVLGNVRADRDQLMQAAANHWREIGGN